MLEEELRRLHCFAEGHWCIMKDDDEPDIGGSDEERRWCAFGISGSELFNLTARLLGRPSLRRAFDLAWGKHTGDLRDAWFA